MAWPNGLVPPTPWQQRTLWAALTALALYSLVKLVLLLIAATTWAFDKMQGLLIPVAVAAILAYLLDPVVEWLTRKGISRTKGVLYVFALFFIPLGGILLWVIPQIYHQSMALGADAPRLFENVRLHVAEMAGKYQEKYAANPLFQQVMQQVDNWTQQQLPLLPNKAWNFVTYGLQGFFGLLGLIVVPIYLFFFLRDGATISRRWSDYLPLRSSSFKDEVVSCLTEINRYLIAFFRGQILVTTIDGALIGIALLIMQLKFAMLIGLLVMILQLVPYLGILLCWIPAVLIAIAQFGDWQHPFIVTVIFIVMVQVDGWFIAPRIVGGAVGLHPMTIIISVIGWSLLIGGLLGALLAVPLTATLKVLLRRYVWERSLARRQIAVPTAAGGSVLVEIPE